MTVEFPTFLPLCRTRREKDIGREMVGSEGTDTDLNMWVRQFAGSLFG